MHTPTLPVVLLQRSFLLALIFGLRLRLSFSVHLEHVSTDAVGGIHLNDDQSPASHA